MVNELLSNTKPVLVTGASSGIGQAVAVHLSKLGYRLMLLARREQLLKETLSKLEGKDHLYVSFDLSDLKGIENVMRLVVERMGPLSGMVHCAGIAPMRPLSLLKPENLHEVMAINFYSYVEMVRCFSKKENFAAPAGVVGISSVASVLGDKGKLGYCSSKAAMDAATRCMAKEMASKGIRINTLRPSYVQTELLDRYTDHWGDSPSVNAFARKHLMGVIKPEQVAAFVAFLLSDSAQTITGSAFPIDSGALA